MEVMYVCNDKLYGARITQICADDYTIVLSDTQKEVNTVESRLIY